MLFGMTIPATAHVPHQARLLEAAGYDYVATGEHLFFNGPTPNTFISLAAAAGATETARLLSSIVLLPLYPAALAAKLASALDVVSGGRLELGIGAGGENPKEFMAGGVPLAERFRRTDESLEVMSRLFSGESVTFECEFTHLDDVRLDPVPLQRPGPPVWLGGRKRGAMRRAARYANVWMPSWSPRIGSHRPHPGERGCPRNWAYGSDIRRALRLGQRRRRRCSRLP